jgi:4-amino-4-deoxy-L-arabinose transferase-like glycosyltransferase
MYGREWQLGYDKLPPLPWWLVEVAYRLVGRDVAYYALAQVTVAAAFAAVWALGLRLVGPLGALVAVLIVDGLHYFNFTAAKFNHDVIQLPFWALTGYAYWMALRERRVAHWALLGFAVGMAFWAKYFVAVLAVPLALFLLLDRDARKALATLGPWIALAVAVLVMAPHLAWLARNDFLPFAYADERAVLPRGALDHLINPAKFLLFQLGPLLPCLLIAAPYLRRDVTAGAAPAVAFGPAATVAALSLVSGRGTVSLWGYPLWLFFGLWIAVNVRPLELVTLWRIVFLWGAVSVCMAAGFVFTYGVRPRYDQHYHAVFFPGRELGIEMSRRFRALTGQQLAYVIGGMWDGGNVAHYAPERPRVLIDGSPRRAPWIDLADLRARGAVVVWTDGGDPRVLPRAYRSIADGAEIQQPFTLSPHLGGPPVVVAWALLRPHPSVAEINSRRE